MRYQKIESKIWNDEKFIKLTPSQQRLFFYILTSPHNNLIGLYVLKTGYACEDLNIVSKSFYQGLESLCRSGLIERDEDVQVIYICNFLKHNPITNPNQKKAAIKALNNLPKTPLILRFLDTYKVLDKGLTEDLRKALSKPEEGSVSVSGTEEGTVSVSGAGTEGTSQIYSEVIGYLNSKLGTKYKSTSEKTKVLIKARQKDGFTLADFKIVINKKSKEWKDDIKMCSFLRPETLFGGKFEGYLNQQDKIKPLTQMERNLRALESI